MRSLQVSLFVLGVVAFLAAIAAAGTELGNDLWRIGIGLELVDLVIMKLWPTVRAA